MMQELGGTLEVPIHVFGPETHMTAIIGYALGITPMVESSFDLNHRNSLLGMSRNSSAGSLKEFVTTSLETGTRDEDEGSSSKRVRIEFASGRKLNLIS